MYFLIFLQALVKKQVDIHKKPLKPIQDVSTRWNSVYYMLDRLIYLKDAIEAVLRDDGNDHLLPSDQTWQLLQDLLDVLQLVEVTTSHLSGERYATMSMTLPFTKGLHAQLEQQAEDRLTVANFKKKLQEQLVTRFSLDDIEPMSVEVLASALDPRFRKLTFLGVVEREDVKHIMIEKALSVSPTSEAVDEPAAKRTKKDALLDRLLGQAAGSTSTTQDIPCEVASYLAEKPARSTEDPLLWWKVNESRFPHVAVLARKYLAAPASSAPAERTFSTSGLVADKLRATLTSEHVNALVFLNKNAALLGLDPAPQLLSAALSSGTGATVTAPQPIKVEGQPAGCEASPELPQLCVVESDDELEV